MEQVSCFQCSTMTTKKLSDTLNPRTGRPFKHCFCSRACYDRWRADQHLEFKARWLKFQRDVWGSALAGRRQVKQAKAVGRRAEIIARDHHLPLEGFTEIDDRSGLSNQFFVDFIATRQNERVLVDATVKLKAYIPHKIMLARSLRMRLFIIHVSPKNSDVYWLHEVPAASNATIRVPATFIRELADRQSLN